MLEIAYEEKHCTSAHASTPPPPWSLSEHCKNPEREPTGGTENPLVPRHNGFLNNINNFFFLSTIPCWFQNFLSIDCIKRLSNGMNQLINSIILSMNGINQIFKRINRSTIGVICDSMAINGQFIALFVNSQHVLLNDRIFLHEKVNISNMLRATVTRL